MTYEEKFAAINALCEASVKMRKPGDWYVQPTSFLGGRGFTECTYGEGSTPQEAIEDHWEKISNAHYPLYAAAGDKHYEWDGFMWKEVPR